MLSLRLQQNFIMILVLQRLWSLRKETSMSAVKLDLPEKMTQLSPSRKEKKANDAFLTAGRLPLFNFEKL